MSSLSAGYFDGRSSRRWPAALTFESGDVVLRGEFGERRIPLADVEIGEAMGAVERQLSFPDGSRCVVADLPTLERWLAEAGIGDSLIVRLQRHWIWAIGSLAGVVTILAGAYFLLLPWVAAKIAPRVPIAVVEALSAQVMASLDSHFLRPSTLPAQTRQRLQGRLEALSDAIGAPRYRLQFRSASLGANAFALPDGQVVVFDELVKAAASDEEVLGVVAHELGHVAKYHGLRRLIQSSVVSFAAAMYLGDLSSIAAGFGAMVLESRYSRRFELEADDYAGKAMLAAGYGTEPLAVMLEKLDRGHPESAARRGFWDLFSSHPDTMERVQRLRQMR